MKNSEAAVIIATILAGVLLICVFCWLGAALIIDDNTMHWEPVPSSSPTTYEWR